MERDAVRRAFEPVDFFEIANLDHPREPIARGCHCLLYGPAGSGKTTLLFQFALIAAKRDPDARVLFVYVVLFAACRLCSRRGTQEFSQEHSGPASS